MDNEVYASYLIPTSRVDALQKRVDKLARRIAKGKTHADFPPAITATRNIMVVMMPDGPHSIHPTKSYPVDTTYADYTWVTLRYQRPALNGWHLVAVYDWEITADGTRTCYVSPVPGQMVLSEFQEVDAGRCDHCHTNRPRTKSVLITKDFLQYKVVGTTCLHDFLGHHSPKTLIDIHSFEIGLRDLVDRPYISDGAKEAHLGVAHVLAVATMLVRKFGYVRSSDVEKTPTVTLASNYLFGRDKYAIEFRSENPILPEDSDKTILTVEWIKAQTGISEYITNLQKCVVAGAVSHKRLGILVSAAFGYQRDCERLAVAAMPKANEWIGSVGGTVQNILAKVARVRKVEGQYGTTTIITLLTTEGNTLTWFASGSQSVEAGEQWNISKSKVKKHDEFNGTKQTVVNYVKYDIIEQQQQAA
jgi:hypothetical protein